MIRLLYLAVISGLALGYAYLAIQGGHYLAGHALSALTGAFWALSTNQAKEVVERLLGGY